MTTATKQAGEQAGDKPEVTAEQVAEHLTMKDAEAIATVYLSLGITASDDPQDIAGEIDECYQGSFRDDAEFAEHTAEECGELPKDLASWIYIDWERSARDLMMDYSEEGGHYFRNV